MLWVLLIPRTVAHHQKQFSNHSNIQGKIALSLKSIDVRINTQSWVDIIVFIKGAEEIKLSLNFNLHINAHY